MYKATKLKELMGSGGGRIKFNGRRFGGRIKHKKCSPRKVCVQRVSKNPEEEICVLALTG